MTDEAIIYTIVGQHLEHISSMEKLIFFFFFNVKYKTEDLFDNLKVYLKLVILPDVPNSKALLKQTDHFAQYEEEPISLLLFTSCHVSEKLHKNLKYTCVPKFMWLWAHVHVCVLIFLSPSIHILFC